MDIFLACLVDPKVLKKLLDTAEVVYFLQARCLQPTASESGNPRKIWWDGVKQHMRSRLLIGRTS